MTKTNLDNISEDNVDPEAIQEILDNYYGKHGEMMSILGDIQIKYGYLSEETLRILAEKTKVSLVDIYGLVSFYKSFLLKPRGKHYICVCTGTACHVRGAPQVLKEFEHQLDIQTGETTPDKEFTLETVKCVGACALGPIVTTDGNYEMKMSTINVKQLIEKVRIDSDIVDVSGDQRIFHIDVGCPHCNHSLMDDGFLIDDHPSIRVTISFGEKHGWLRLSSMYGSPNISSEYEIPINTETIFFCPHCHAKLVSSWNCPACKAPMIMMVVRGAKTIQFCSRRGCKEHMLDINVGLCMNCKHRDVCRLPRLEGTIWHCEEFE